MITKPTFQLQRNRVFALVLHVRTNKTGVPRDGDGIRRRLR